MRLLHRNSDGGLELTRFLRSEETHPKYAILSLTWLTDEEEVSFDDLIKGLAKTKPAGYSKIQFCAERAAKDGLDHFWVDTCCINKRSSEELQESIISMFSWYRNAVKCYVYLTDVSTQEALDVDMSKELPPYSWELAFRHSRWFTRGWTLQELLAPSCVEFFSAQGRRLGDKESLEQWIHEITGIPIQALRGDPLDEFSIAERLSWQENRRTGRKEDKAYCLLGIFNIFMPHLYGEGDHAFARLQAELDKKHTESDRLDNLLSILPVASEAAFNSLNNQHESTCLPNTRTELLQDISKWVDGVDGFANKCVFWLNGIAGTGKSTVARTVARTYHDRKILAASFFFSKGGGELGDGKKTLTTLAWQIATRFPSAKRHICEAIMKHKDIADQSLRDQWYQLIISPLSKINSKSSSSTILLVIDALDECNDWQDVTAILKELHTAGTLSNIRLRIFITSRPEIPIRLGIAKIPDEKRQVLELHEISSTLINRDLQLYFEKSLLDIREERGFEEDWPGLRIIKRLVESSCGLFIWASTACRYIREGRRLAMKRITKLLNQHLKGAGPEKQLDQIYTTVLIDSIQQGYSEEEREEIYQTLREVLGSIVVLFSPLSMDSLATLRGIPLSDIKETLADLHTIFNMSSQPSAPIRLHHPTFRDFLIDKERCYDLNFWVDAKQAHKALADSCLALMETLLKRDICRLGSPGILSENIDPSRIKQCISPELQYACLYWVEHYRQSGAPLRDGDRAHQFLQKHLLHWLEAINLIGKSSEMGAILRLYHAMLLVSFHLCSRQISFYQSLTSSYCSRPTICAKSHLSKMHGGFSSPFNPSRSRHLFRYIVQVSPLFHQPMN